MRERLLLTLAALALAIGPAPATDGDKPGPDMQVAPSRFGEREPDVAYGAFQRGLYITALNLALPKAKEGHGPSQALVAEIYSRGLGVARDPAEATKWYGKAAEQGIPQAQLQYALALIAGEHVSKDEEKARELMRAAADSGNALAQFNYAQMLMENEGAAESRAQAVAYYERAANAGLADAQYAMGIVYLNGTGGRARDREQAEKWLRAAARQNFDTAQLDLATLLVESRNAADEKEGFAWMKRAAEGGNVAAQNRLAKLYAQAIGTEPDPVAAGAWAIVASRAGLNDPLMADFLQGLTDEQRRKALDMANGLH